MSSQLEDYMTLFLTDFSSFSQIHLFSAAQVSELNCVLDVQMQLSSLASPKTCNLWRKRKDSLLCLWFSHVILLIQSVFSVTFRKQQDALSY